MSNIGRLTVALIALILVVPGAAAQDLRAGAAKVDITPPTGYAMWGYGARHDAPSSGVLDPLYARALVLAVGEQRIALVGLDLGRAPMRQATAAIRARVKAEAGIEHIFLVGSHTHHGPVIELDNWPKGRVTYVRELEDKLAGVIVAAAKDARPARLGVAAKEVPLNRNRHSKRADKPVDKELLVLRVEDHQGKPIAHAVNFAAHPTMHPAQVLKFSADFPGAMAKLVEEETGAPCVFLQGAAGDLSANPPAPLRGPEQFGQALGQEVLAMAKSIRCAPLQNPRLKACEDDFRFTHRIDLKNPLVRGMLVAAFFEDLVAAFEREYRDGVRPHLTTALLDDRIGFVGVSGEFFCSHALSVKRRARLEHVFFLGYCNDYHQYFPTIEGAAEGGYGADAGVSAAEVGAGERIIDRALVRLYSMRSQRPSLPPQEVAAEPTKVVRVTPRDKATGTDVHAPVQIHFSNGLKLTTINADSVRLLDAAGKPVAVKLSSDIEGDVVNVQPARALLPRTSYTIEVTGKLIDRAGASVAPFRSSFTTGARAAPAIAKEGFRYSKTKVDDERGPTAIAVGPDGHVYVSTYDGILYRLRIDARTGLPAGKDKLLALAGRKILGLTFDPEASADKLVAWITYDDRKAEQVDTGTFSGVVSRVVIPAPRSAGAPGLHDGAT
jgi:hypothetical protein